MLFRALTEVEPYRAALAARGIPAHLVTGRGFFTPRPGRRHARPAGARREPLRRAGPRPRARLALRGRRRPGPGRAAPAGPGRRAGRDWPGAGALLPAARALDATRPALEAAEALRPLLRARGLAGLVRGGGRGARLRPGRPGPARRRPPPREPAQAGAHGRRLLGGARPGPARLPHDARPDEGGGRPGPRRGDRRRPRSRRRAPGDGARGQGPGVPRRRPGRRLPRPAGDLPGRHRRPRRARGDPGLADRGEGGLRARLRRACARPRSPPTPPRSAA